jgi:Rhodanese-like domain
MTTTTAGALLGTEEVAARLPAQRQADPGGGRGHRGLRPRPCPGGAGRPLAARPAGPDPPPVHRPRGLRGADGPAGRRQPHPGGPLRRQQQLVRRLRLLVLPLLPPAGGADGRRPQEVGAGGPPPDHRGASRHPGEGYRVKGPAGEIRALRDQVERALGRPGVGLVDVRSPEEYRGELLAPPHLPQEQAQRPGHIPGARNIP